MTDHCADLTFLTAAELARRIACGELSAVEAVEAHIRRCEAVHARLNALVVPLFDEARAAARAADARRGRGEPLGPLHGVPVTIKELFDVAGTPTTLGLAGRVGRVAAADAPPVARLRRAGAVVLGKTNVPQIGLMYETDNPLYGRTNNPWNLDRSPGGSSGGEAALIAAGGSPLGLGSDAGGSIRQPGHSCGVHGFKPTSGRLTLRGHARFPAWINSYVQPGPLARSVADLALALRVLADPDDPDVAPAALGDPAAVSVARLRIGWFADDGYFAPAPAVRRAVREAAAALAATGARVEEFRPPDGGEAWRVFLGMIYSDGLAFIRRMLGRSPALWQVREYLRGAALPGPLRPAVAWLAERFGQRRVAEVYRRVRRRTASAADCWRLLDDQAAFRDRLLAAFDAGRFDAVVCPPNALPALPHGGYRAGFGGSYSLVFNVAGLPAGVVAATRVRPGEESDRPPSNDIIERAARAAEEGSAGLPVGVQVAARPWRDEVALAVMAALEAHFRNRPDYPARPPVE
jgi:fatty acid amide hydrolase